ncbi:STY4534 family ICE replication protein [Gallibacterium genomosp. 3]|uniref:STY4534 family ICE replication protein n=1 Tax=Gallibacterium genomosp. 3 TaxID=505345 RepID=UPI0009F21F82|nr:STY4534 family ICE replication protein [Gallibacterium genomosp. 3]
MTTQYFNLHTTGIGYLNNIREVQPKKGKPFLACRIAALTGDSTAPEYRYFDTNVVGKDAEKLIRRCKNAVEEGRKVLISFVLADLWTDTYIVAKDSKFHKKGDAATSLKARLIRIKMIKIDGEVKYFASNSEDMATDNQSVVVDTDHTSNSENITTDNQSAVTSNDSNHSISDNDDDQLPY